MKGSNRYQLAAIQWIAPCPTAISRTFESRATGWPSPALAAVTAAPRRIKRRQRTPGPIPSASSSPHLPTPPEATIMFAEPAGPVYQTMARASACAVSWADIADALPARNRTRKPLRVPGGPATAWSGGTAEIERVGSMSTINRGAFPHRHLLGIEGLSADEITMLLDLSDGYVEQNRQKDKKRSVLRGLTVINVFFETSTRTRTSFELAGK